MSDLIEVNNYIGGRFVPPSTGKYLIVENPADMSEVGNVALSSGMTCFVLVFACVLMEPRALHSLIVALAFHPPM